MLAPMSYNNPALTFSCSSRSFISLSCVPLTVLEFVEGMSILCDNLYHAVDLTIRCSFLSAVIAQP